MVFVSLFVKYCATNVMLCANSNLNFAALCMMYAPGQVKEDEEKEAVGGIMVSALSSSRFSNSLLSSSLPFPFTILLMKVDSQHYLSSSLPFYSSLSPLPSVCTSLFRACFSILAFCSEGTPLFCCYTLLAVIVRFHGRPTRVVKASTPPLLTLWTCS